MDGIQQRKSASWMVQLDERILEYIEIEGWASPRLLAKTTGFSASKGRISDRCKRLHYTGFIEPIHGEMYDITVEGRMYLAGEIDAAHQPEPVAEVVFRQSTVS